jgi:hypothetical protein
MPFERAKVLIWGKTYPELSSRYAETVCTGGCREDGKPIRLYPVPLRYLEDEQKYSLYDWIDVPIERNRRDPRPESYKIRGENIHLVSKVSTDADGWRQRRESIFRDTSWHYKSLAGLKADEMRSSKSIGLVTPGEIRDVCVIRKSDRERQEYESKMAQIQNQTDIFRPEYKSLEFLPFEVRLRWHCAEPCPECHRSPHDMKVLDWGLLELARREGWEKARQRLETISNIREYDFRLFMGNFRLHPKNFGIIGLWYPKIPDQGLLL